MSQDQTEEASTEEQSPEEQEKLRQEFGDRMFVGMLRRLQLQKRVPLFCAQRGWPEDDDFQAALASVVVLFALNQGAAVVNRPDSADKLGEGLWPEGSPVVELFASLHLATLLQDPPPAQDA